MDDQDEERARHIYETLAVLRQQYEAAIRPYIDELVRIESMKTRTSLVMDPTILDVLKKADLS